MKMVLKRVNLWPFQAGVPRESIKNIYLLLPAATGERRIGCQPFRERLCNVRTATGEA